MTDTALAAVGATNTVFFATNRVPLAPFAAPWFGYAPTPLTPDGLLFAEATVSGTIIADASSGTIDDITALSPGSLSAGSRTKLANSTRDLLIFVHGFANSFNDAITRAAYNREWLAQSGLPAADMDVLAFTWPSSGSLISIPPDFPDDAYLADQGRASASGYHLAHFLNEASKLFTGFDPGLKRRVILLAHSMGNWALQAGVEAFFAQVPLPPLRFDEVVLAAADEEATTFGAPDGTRLSLLPKIAGRVSVYSHETDVALAVSRVVNGNIRLGQFGADGKADSAKYPPESFRNVDCTGVHDYDWLNPVDATHQYYRRSPTVRADIAALIGGAAVAPGVSKLSTAELVA
jgi:esterase/lipase superfamily enzyme